MFESSAVAPVLTNDPAACALAAPALSSPRRRRATRRLLAAIARNDLDLACRSLPQADLAFEHPDTGHTPLSAAAVAGRGAVLRAIVARLKDDPDTHRLRAHALVHLLQGWPSQPRQASGPTACLAALLPEAGLGALPRPRRQGWLFLALPCDNVELAELLCSQGASPADRGVGGETLLHAAIDSEAPLLFEWALFRQIDPNLADELGDTPLHNAVACGKLGWANRLLEAGGDPDRVNCEGLSPLALAMSQGESGQAWSTRIRQARLQARWSWSSELPAPNTRL